MNTTVIQKGGCFLEYSNKTFCIEVSGEFACFTRPELKVERVSYDVMTPSAARGVLQSIFWKPAIRWQIRRIDVMNEIRWISLRRNELSTIMSNQSGIFIEDNRQQRAGLFLRDVRYRIHADLVFIPMRDRSPSERRQDADDENPGKYNAIFQRRMQKGQCFTMPYLGCREFSCSSMRLVDDEDDERPWNETRSLGVMLYDLDYSNRSHPTPMFFRAEMENGTISVPLPDSEAILR